MTDVRRLPGPHADHWDWQLHGACRGLDSSLFFHPENERGPSRTRREAEAKAICQTCPVVTSCRQHSLAVREPYGVWGGLTESERAQLLGTSRDRALDRPAPSEPAASEPTTRKATAPTPVSRNGVARPAARRTMAPTG